ncbi:phosphoenolpyruvate carboxylase [Gynuella sunshinyii]|uniref:Phosphoenolpyruvate carboxylase n=1 Tax=Gynuella sunshinyii YC6258 TaxID=1445510 RepID=A0A0C5VPR8_9GAMM|nr:phosphoenolpyruvate carboxylase [Gynuella sunshinyii]AJQ95423.1 phosphoenolpyruvate carboxylase [Gynuella sunshinyii YC6258]
MKLPDQLHQEIQNLGAILGQTIAKDQGVETLTKIETIRELGKTSRDDEEAFKQLFNQFNNSSNHELLVLSRAFAKFLNLANIAEQEYANTVEGEELTGKEKTREEFFDKLKDSSLSKEQIQKAINALSIDLVLTAHPTEVSRRTMIQKFNEINHCLRGKPFGSSVPSVSRRLEDLITQSWHSNEIRSQRPTPIDEAKWGFAVIEQTLWNAVPRFIKELKSQVKEHADIELPENFSPVKFSSWMGGDRDGNPFVTSDVTESVLLLARWEAADLFIRDIKSLIGELSMTTANEELKAATQNSEEPYRHILKQLRQQLRDTRAELEAKVTTGQWNESNVMHDNQQLLEPLLLCYRSLVECGMDSVANGKLMDTLIRARCFGIFLVKLDIRQHSERHSQVIEEITQSLGLGSYQQWGEEHKQEFLVKELSSNRPLIPLSWQPSDDVREVLDTLKLIARQNPEALGIYIISMASEVSDVLAVQLLLKACGLTFKLPIAPLFETLDDLNNAEQVIQKLFANVDYRDYMDGHQYVMVGYSDSAKDAGVLSAAWAQYQAQENLVKLCRQEDIKLTLFHGRGGTIGRGGGPAHSAILSQPPGSLAGGFRVTEQGETIRLKFGTTRVAQKSLALYANAILEAMILPPPEPKAEWREVMHKLSDLACEHYRDYVKSNDQFVTYFRQATPEQELGRLPLGSRPSKRKKDNSIESLRAIPWIFAWAQNRLVLPAWLGATQAIQELYEQGAKEPLLAMKEHWPFFTTRLDMLEMVFVKADPAISAIYEEILVEDALKPIGESLRTQLKNDLKFILEFTGKESLMQNEPWNKASIRLRASYLAPLHLMQVVLLQRLREMPEVDNQHVITQAMMITIAGIAAGIRNTG